MYDHWRAVDLRHQKNGQIRIFDPQNNHVANVLASNSDCAAIATRIVTAMNAYDKVQPEQAAGAPK